MATNYLQSMIDLRQVKDNKPTIDYGKIKVGLKDLDDAVLSVGTLKKINPRLADKKNVITAIEQYKISEMQEISNFFFKTSGIYSRLCRYMAYLYRYDWMLTPYIKDKKQSKDKIINGFQKILDYLDDFGVKRFCGEIALKVIRNGCYYGYIIEQKDTAMIQELAPSYCRSRFKANGRPVVEFNMAYFDDQFSDTRQRLKILNLFPKEFKKGYTLYKQGKIPPETIGEKGGWYLLDTKYAFKFNLNDEDFPAFISVIPAIIDLDEAQELDKKKMQQQLLKIIIQRMPLDKNGNLVFDPDEAQMLHNNAVRMLGKAIGIDVLTTFAETDVADMSDRTSVSSMDELSKVERAIFNEAGVSQMQFNSSGNMALEKSVLNDEASMNNLLLQFEDLLNALISNVNKSRKVTYRVQLLNTTIYNYKELAKLYKEQTQLGYSKMLPQIALGQSQNSILANAYFENEILNLVEMFIPPMSSNTMSSDSILKKGKTDSTNKKTGRPQKDEDQLSDKTILNKESM